MDKNALQRAAEQRSYRKSRKKTVRSQFNVRIDKDICDSVRKYAEKLGLSQSWIAQEALSSYLWNMKGKNGKERV